MMNRFATYPDIGQALPWRTFDDGVREATERGVPILALAEPAWTNVAQRLAHVLDQNPSLRETIGDRVVPVLVDQNERPDLADRWRQASVALTGSAGPPLLLLLSHEGLPFLAFASIRFEGDDEYPSLGAIVTATANAYAADVGAILREARALTEPAEPSDSHGDDIHDSASPADRDARWVELRTRIDSANGGLDESPKHPRPALLWSLLDAHDAGDLPDDLTDWLRLTLRAMERGGIHDQLDRGFHRCSRDARWVVPHFEKPIPLNAHLAAVYARAGQAFDDRDLSAIGRELVGFCADALRNDVDVVASDTPYYTWQATDFLRQLSPPNMQAVSLLYNLVPGEVRQVLYRANTVGSMERFSRETPESLQAKIDLGRAELLAARRRRDAPQPITLPAFFWRAETIRWLLVVARWEPSVPVDQVTAALERLTPSGLQEGTGYVRPDASAWLHDQAALLGAFVAAMTLQPDGPWRDRAVALADVLITHYRAGGTWLDHPDDLASHSRATVDDIVPAAIATLTESLRALTGLTGADRYAHAAKR